MFKIRDDRRHPPLKNYSPRRNYSIPVDKNESIFLLTSVLGNHIFRLRLGQKDSNFFPIVKGGMQTNLFNVQAVDLTIC